MPEITIINIGSPVFAVILNNNVNTVDRKCLNMCREGWYPVGDKGRKGNSWVQVMMKETPSEGMK
jgi:hypothetical protein